MALIGKFQEPTLSLKNMTTKLSSEILDRFLELMQQNPIVGKNLAKKLYESISNGNYSKDDIESILKKETDNNENT